MKTQRRRFPFLMLTTALALASCSVASTASFLDTASRGIFVREDVNLKDKDYAAADYLIQQSRGFVSMDDLIHAVPLRDSEHPEMSSTLARQISQDVGVRLSQLGYRINLEEVAGVDTNYLKPAIQSGEKPDYILAGTYHRARKTIEVSLRIVNAESGAVAGAFDYTMPRNNEINDLSEPQARIFKVTK